MGCSSYFVYAMRKVLLLLLALWSAAAGAQIISSIPVFPTENDTMTIIYDASEGNSALINLGPPEVYAHTGVITDKSPSANSWRYVQGTWGTADAKVRMTYLGQNQYSLRFFPRDFYGVPQGEKILSLAFVFRDRAGNKVGREADGSDIFYHLYDNQLSCRFLQPNGNDLILEKSDTLHIDAASSIQADLSIQLNGNLLKNTTDTALSINYQALDTGEFILSLLAVSGNEQCRDSVRFVVRPDRPAADAPSGSEDGISYPNENSVYLQLHAPGKKHVYVIGDFNDWKVQNAYLMNKSLDGQTFWLKIDGLEKGREYGFQYLIDGEIRVGDPYAALVLDPFNDGFIPSATYASIPPYPTNKTTGIVSVLKPGASVFNWSDNNYSRPLKTDLVIYELLVRDFIGAQNYQTLIDTLDYLSRLGINAIELMPVNEFEGNLSWGYNPSYHGALDKYYGSIEDFKSFVDACHQRGIAVILDAVFNHAFSQSPLCQMYWDEVNFRPAADNPWLNVVEKHPFNVGYDFNHESPATQRWMDQLLQYWVQEFHVDGFRFDLSKGFTQRNTLGDVGAWGQYDNDRVRLLKRMAAELWKQDADLYVILEHFANNDEETELANSGMMLWGNLVHAYNEAAMGYNADMNWGSYKNRGWNDPHLVTCLETHDEERLMYKTRQFGNGSGSYNTKEVSTALDRMELAGALFFPIPGPKMIWQFTELGYDVSIDFNGRTGEKPIRWNYYTETDRRDLYEVYADLIHLRIKEPAFESRDFNIDLASAVKRIWINHQDMDVLVLGNCDVKPRLWSAGFQKAARWYEFFSGDSIDVSDPNMDLSLEAGEYRLYTTKRLNRIYGKTNVNHSGSALSLIKGFEVHPNPVAGELTIETDLNISEINLMDASGRLLLSGKEKRIDMERIPSGIYFIALKDETGKVWRHKVLKP